MNFEILLNYIDHYNNTIVQKEYLNINTNIESSFRLDLILEYLILRSLGLPNKSFFDEELSYENPLINDFLILAKRINNSDILLERFRYEGLVRNWIKPNVFELSMLFFHSSILYRGMDGKELDRIEILTSLCKHKRPNMYAMILLYRYNGNEDVIHNCLMNSLNYTFSNLKVYNDTGHQTKIDIFCIPSILEKITNELSIYDIYNLSLTSKLFSGQIWNNILMKRKNEEMFFKEVFGSFCIPLTQNEYRNIIFNNFSSLSDIYFPIICESNILHFKFIDDNVLGILFNFMIKNNRKSLKFCVNFILNLRYYNLNPLIDKISTDWKLMIFFKIIYNFTIFLREKYTFQNHLSKIIMLYFLFSILIIIWS